MSAVTPAQERMARMPGARSPGNRPVPSLSPGDMVTHDKFGLGTVVSTDGYGDQAEAKIDFGGRLRRQAPGAALRPAGEVVGPGSGPAARPGRPAPAAPAAWDRDAGPRPAAGPGWGPARRAPAGSCRRARPVPCGGSGSRPSGESGIVPYRCVRSGPAAPALAALAGRPAERAGLAWSRRHMNQRTVVSAMASRVASTITKNPLAIHWAAPTASSVLFDGPVVDHRRTPARPPGRTAPAPGRSAVRPGAATVSAAATVPASTNRPSTEPGSARVTMVAPAPSAALPTMTQTPRPPLSEPCQIRLRRPARAAPAAIGAAAARLRGPVRRLVGRPPGRAEPRAGLRHPTGWGAWRAARAGSGAWRVVARAGHLRPAAGDPGRADPGRAAWLQARRRMACSGVHRAIVGRSYVLWMLVVARW